MRLITEYIQKFLNRAGSYVLISTILSRLLSFITSWIALQLINNKELGEVLYAWNIITFIIPFIGLGLAQSLIKYGAQLNNETDKKSLLHYVVKNGVISSFLLSLTVSIIALLFPFTIKSTGLYISLFSIAFIPMFILQTIKIQLRLQHNNKTYSVVEICYSIVLFLLVTLLCYFFKENGYIIALIASPTIIAIIYYNKIKTDKSNIKKLSITDIEFWKFGIFGGLTNVATILLFAIDILLIGNLLMDVTKITAYRYLSLIPFSLLFLPRVFMTTDFVTFTEKINSKEYIFNYIKSYTLLFSIISFILLSFSYLFSNEILNLFDSSYPDYSETFFILNVGVCGILILRGLFGNLLSSLGLVKANLYITLSALVINYISNHKLIPLYGIKGAAITSAGLLWYTGIASTIVFFWAYKKHLLLLKNK